MTRHRAIALLILLTLPPLAFMTAGPATVALKVLVVLSKADGAYAQVLQTMQSELAAQSRSDIEIKVQSLDHFRAADANASAPALIVAVGTEAAQRVAQSNPAAPILHTLLPRATAIEILRAGRGGKSTTHRDSAIFLDQPIGRQLDLLRLALPSHKRVAVILGPATRNQEAELRAAARERSLTVNIVTLDHREELLPALEKLLDRNDVLFSVPEPLAYNSETIHHVLLTTYRYKIPVMGMSKAYVDAGALLGIYSTPEQIGHQAARLIASLPVAKALSLPTPSYPRHFMISVNRRVATSLDLSLDSENALQHKLQALPQPKQ